MQLFQAHQQWATRPADERFWDLAEMEAVTRQYAELATEERGSWKDVRAVAIDSDLRIEKANGTLKTFVPTHHAFGQICQHAEAPTAYLRKLPAELAAVNLNYGIQQAGEGSGTQFLVHPGNGLPVIRGATSARYDRIWNFEIVQRLLNLHAGWRNPPARPVRDGDTRTRIATAEDAAASLQGGLGIREGDVIGPAGLYASDHDMFAFLVNVERVIEDGTGTPLMRGFIIRNSEVGGESLLFMRFLFEGPCGNHIIWGARGVEEYSVRHVGRNASQAWGEIVANMRAITDEESEEDEAKIQQAREIRLGTDKESALDTIVKLCRMESLTNLPRKRLEEAYNASQAAFLGEPGAAVRNYGDPRSPWALVNALTELSQKYTWADARHAIDRDAGKLLAAVVG